MPTFDRNPEILSLEEDKHERGQVSNGNIMDLVNKESSDELICLDNNGM